MASPLPSPEPLWLKNGVSAISLTDTRWQYCNIKSIALLPNILLRQQALDQQAMEAILIRDGLVTEGAASNIFIVEQGVLKTPAKDRHLLPGITRDLIVELARDNKMACEECALTESQLLSAEEIWLTSSSKEIAPVVEIDGRPVGDGRPGDVWLAAQTLFSAHKFDF